MTNENMLKREKTKNEKYNCSIISQGNNKNFLLIFIYTEKKKF